MILAGVWGLYYAFSLAIASIAPLVYLIMSDLGLNRGEMGTLLAAWQFVFILVAVPCGGLLDRFGPRRMMLAAALIIALSMVMRGIAVDYWTLLAAVMVFGIGGPLISSGAPKVVSLWFTGKERGLALGIYFTGNACGAMTAIGLANSVLLPAVGGHWENVMFLFSGIVVLSGVIWFAISSRAPARAMEVLQTRGRKQRPQEAFVELARDPSVRFILLLGLLVFFHNHGMYQWLPDLLHSHGMTPAQSGYWAIIPALVGMISAVTIPRAAVPARRFGILCALFCGAALAVLLIWSGSTFLLATGLVLQGLCRGAVISIVLLLLMDASDGESNRVGSASGLFFSIGEIGGVLGPVSVGVLAHWSGGFDLPLLMMFVICGLLLLILSRLRALVR